MIKEKVLGPDHPGIATTLSNRAGLLRSQVGMWELIMLAIISPREMLEWWAHHIFKITDENLLLVSRGRLLRPTICIFEPLILERSRWDPTIPTSQCGSTTGQVY